MWWLYARVQELDMTLAELAEKIDRSEQTVKNWVFTLQKVPWRLEDTEDWQRLAEALNWTILDVLRAAGYRLPLDDASIDVKGIAERLDRLDKSERVIVMKFISGLLEVVESGDLSDLPYGHDSD